MKVLQVNCVYQKGSTGKIVLDIHKCLMKQGIESIVCYGRGSLIKENGVYKFCSELESKIYHLLNKFGWLMYAVCPIATRKLIGIIKKERPDIVHLHCINGYCLNIYTLLNFLAKHNFRTVITHHAEFLYTGNCGHAFDCKKFSQNPGCGNCGHKFSSAYACTIDTTRLAWHRLYNSYSKFSTHYLRFTAVSPWVRERSLLSPLVNRFECDVILNGLDTNIFHYKKSNILQKKKDVHYLLFVTAIFNPNDKYHIKGGWYIVELARLNPDKVFVIVAAECHTPNFDKPQNVIFWGRTANQEELSELYASADVTVISSRRETFSMVTAESLCCGTPVIGFKAGGPESIAMPDYTSFVDYGDLKGLNQEMEKLLKQDINKKVLSEMAIHQYSSSVMSNKYISIYKELLKS